MCGTGRMQSKKLTMKSPLPEWDGMGPLYRGRLIIQ